MVGVDIRLRTGQCECRIAISDRNKSFLSSLLSLLDWNFPMLLLKNILNISTVFESCFFHQSAARKNRTDVYPSCFFALHFGERNSFQTLSRYLKCF